MLVIYLSPSTAQRSSAQMLPIAATPYKADWKTTANFCACAMPHQWSQCRMLNCFPSIYCI